MNPKNSLQHFLKYRVKGVKVVKGECYILELKNNKAMYTISSSIEFGHAKIAILMVDDGVFLRHCERGGKQISMGWVLFQRKRMFI